MFEYSHLVHIDKKQNKLLIYRVYEDGKKHLYTEIALPEVSESQSIEIFKEFSKTLGENILIDSASARQHFNI